MKWFPSLILKVSYFFIVGIICWLIIANINAVDSGSSAVLLLIPLAIAITIVFASINKDSSLIKIFLDNKKLVLTTSALLIVFSIAIRLFFITLSYNPTSDPQTFLSMAKLLSDGDGLWGAIYVGLFPYTLSFDLLLSLGLNVFQSEKVAIFVINLIFDLLSSYVIYLISYKLTKDRAVSLLYASLFFINPFCLLFSVLSIPVAAVNSFILTSLLSIYLLTENIRTNPRPKSIILYGALSGLSLAILSFFRPVSIIFLLALLIYLGVICLTKKNRKTLTYSLVGLFISVSIYLIGSLFYSSLVKNITGYSTGSSSGWSIYIGTNLEHKGQWNIKDKELQIQLGNMGMSPSEIHSEMTTLAIERLRSYSLKDTVGLLVDKSIVLGGKQKDSLFNLKSYPAIAERGWVQLGIQAVSLFTILLLLMVTLWGLIKQKMLNLNYILYVSLLFIGLFISSLLVEVNPRYFTPFIPIIFVAIILLFHGKR